MDTNEHEKILECADRSASQVDLTYPSDPCNSVVKSSLASHATDDNFLRVNRLVSARFPNSGLPSGGKVTFKWIKRPNLKSPSARPSSAVVLMLVPSTEPKD